MKPFNQILPAYVTTLVWRICFASTLFLTGCHSNGNNDNIEDNTPEEIKNPMIAIVDVMVAEADTVASNSIDYTGIDKWSSEPYIPNVTGSRMTAMNVNADVVGTTTGIYVKYATVDIASDTQVLTGYKVANFENFGRNGWEPRCPEGWRAASGKSFGASGALSENTENGCKRMGLCVKFEAINTRDSFVTNMSLSITDNSDPNCPLLSKSNGLYWTMIPDLKDIHTGCSDSKKYYMCGASAYKVTSNLEAKTIDVSDNDKYSIMEKYAPKIYLHSEETYKPSSVDRYFNNVFREKRGGKYSLNTYDAVNGIDVLDFFEGSSILPDVPVYAYWVEHTIELLQSRDEIIPGSGQPPNTEELQFVDIVYFMFYPYNQGKAKLSTILGNHVADWEHVTLRMDGYNQDTLRPVLLYSSAHSGGKTTVWNSNELKKQTTHPVIFAAKGSHGHWLNEGLHVYASVPGIGNLTDYTDEGSVWDTWNNIVAFDYKTQINVSTRETWPRWMRNDYSADCADDNPGCDPLNPVSGAIYRWGNEKNNCDFLSGECILNDGPTGPIEKHGIWNAAKFE